MKLLQSVVALIILVISSSSGFADQKFREKLQTLIELLNDPDPIIRLDTYQDAIKSGDATIKRIALKTALQGTDSDLRAMALRGAFADLKMVTFSLSEADKVASAITDAGEDQEELEKVKTFYSHYFKLLNSYQRNLSIQLDKYDFQSGRITGFCLNGLEKKHDKYKVNGTIIGDKLSLKANCYVSSYYNMCSLNAELNKSGKLEGHFTCGNQGYSSKAELEFL